MGNQLLTRPGLGSGLLVLAIFVSQCLASALIPFPHLGAERRFDLTLTWEEHAPDGRPRDMILINGQFPGPRLEMGQGDQVEVVVHNKMPYDTTVHFHGIEMHLTPWSDGVPGVSQRHIKPGKSFTYKWTATQYGSYWYHAHHRGQLDDGMYGALLIHPRKQIASPFEIIAKDKNTLGAIKKAAAKPKQLILSDFRHVTSVDADSIMYASNLELPCYDSILLNGKGSVDCWSSEKIASLVRPDQEAFLQAGNGSMTAKGCLPAEILASVLGAGLPSNVSAIPPKIFDVCTPSTGPKEEITVLKKDCDEEKWVALDLVGAFGLHTAFFSIDELSMYVYAVDGEYVEPQLVHAISVTNGDRYSILLKLTDVGDYPIRAVSNTAVQLLTGQGTLSVKSADKKDATPNKHTTTPYFLDNGVPISEDVVLYDRAMEKPFPAEPVGQKADQTFKLSMRMTDSIFSWTINGTVFPHTIDSQSDPILFQSPPDAPKEDNITITTQNGTWVDLIFVTATFPMPPHPMHKHGNKMRMIGIGEGEFPWETVEEAMTEIPESFNLANPPRRDGFATNPAITGPTWMAVRYHVTNPGAWLVHCHIQSHLIGGMSMVIQDGVDRWPTVPVEYLGMA